jgi:hypothetical protein
MFLKPSDFPKVFHAAASGEADVGWSASLDRDGV